jgi:hypothetical protein
MDPKSKEILDAILRKEPAALSEGDRDILRARRSYLTASDLERYAEILGTPKKSGK